MSYPPRLLAPGEAVVKQMRPHWRALIVPGLWLGLLLVAGGFLLTLISVPVLRWILLAAAGIALLVFVVVPVLRWYSSEYVFTDRRVITRWGVLSKSGRDVPVEKINNISFEQSILGRVLNYGDLIIDSANVDGALTIRDVPNVEEIQRDVYQLGERRTHRGNKPS